MAKEKRSLRKVLIVIVAAALIFLGTLLGECGFGTGLGPGLRGLTPGAGPAASTPAVASASAAPDASAVAPAACALRLDRESLRLDGRPIEIPAAVEACKQSGKADLVTTGDAVYGDLERLRAALHDAGVFVLERRP